MKKNIVFCSVVLFLLGIQLTGCTTVQTGYSTVQKEMTSFWNRVKVTLKEIQGGSREDAVVKYHYKGQRDAIFVELPAITPSVAKPDDTIDYELQYALLSPQRDKRFTITETAFLTINGEPMELMRKDSDKAQGIHVSSLEFTIPRDLDPGIYKIVSTIKTGNLIKKVEGKFTVKK
jgi:hypothetical protein